VTETPVSMVEPMKPPDIERMIYCIVFIPMLASFHSN